MKISSFNLRNYRRLADISLVLDDEKTILVGANNSGKTSCIGALHTFLVYPDHLKVRDISKHNWKAVSEFGSKLKIDQMGNEDIESLSSEITELLPSLDVIFSANANEAYKIRDIVPHLDWKGGKLAVRINFEPSGLVTLANDFTNAREVVAERDDLALWPKDLFDFLEKGQNFSKYFKPKYYILNLDIEEGSPPELQPLKSNPLKKLVRIDVISEQRGLGTEDASHKTGPFSEKQRLNKLLREYYDIFLDPDAVPEPGDLEVLEKQQEMEKDFTGRLKTQFGVAFSELKDMGYPGIGGNPSVEIAAKISGADALQKTSSVRYRFKEDDDDTLPESYLGLGYQNLIYLTFRLLSFRDRWMRVGKSIKSSADLKDKVTEQIEPIHLVLVEEPEVNLHAQVQRVFIKQAYRTLRNNPLLEEGSEYQTQLVVSTHSSHIVNDVDFKDLRYFRRSSENVSVKMDHSVIENMSDLFAKEEEELKFVRKHLKLTHCDIFFADGVIFVEGQAERLLVPEFIEQNFEELTKCYLSILEVSGSHTHKYRELIEKLGITALVVTDLDSVGGDKKSAVPARNKGQKTKNYTLKGWHPKKELIDDLIDISKDKRITTTDKSSVFVAYQKPLKINGKEVVCRTFEDALILTNFNNRHFKKINEKLTKSGENLPEDLFNYVQGLTKGDFAFNCLQYLAEDDKHTFEVPEYISEGLGWLQESLSIEKGSPKKS